MGRVLKRKGTKARIGNRKNDIECWICDELVSSAEERVSVRAFLFCPSSQCLCCLCPAVFLGLDFLLLWLI